MVIQRIREVDPKATGFIDAGGDIGIIGPKFKELVWVIGIWVLSSNTLHQ